MPLSPHKDGITVQVRLTPGARQAGILGLMDIGEGKTALKVSVNVVAEGGKANHALFTLLAKSWGLPKSAFSLLSGAANRQKVILISGNGIELMKTVSAQIRAQKDKT